VSVVVLHARLAVLQLARLPAFVVPTLLFPVMVFVLFGIGQATSEPAADALLASYAAFAVLGVVLFQFGVGIATERGTPWERFVRTLPVTAAARIIARLVAAVVFATAAATGVAVVAVAATPVALGPADAVCLAAVLLVGAVPFGLMGVTIGYWSDPRAALPIANLLYLPLAYLGGLWALPTHRSALVARLSGWLPTGQWSRLLTAAALGRRLPPLAALGLAAWGVVFGASALLGYRRDEARQYR
jgi:ABC-2 type transport system permease protein